MRTYSAHFFKVPPMVGKVYELLVEEPGELELQRGVVGHLARQDDALAHRDIHGGRLGDNHRRLWGGGNAQADRQTGRQTDIQAGRQTERGERERHKQWTLRSVYLYIYSHIGLY